MTYEEIVSTLEELSDPKALEGMARYGITPAHAYGVKIPHLRKIAKEAGRNHELANRLWAKDTRETRILAGMIDEPDKVTEKQMEQWVGKFDYWEICDQVIMNLFDRTLFTWKKAVEWPDREEEFVRRAGFALIARLAWTDRKATDEDFEKLFPLIRRHSVDSRSMVKKAVNWALRQIGKRNKALNRKAIALAREIRKLDSKAARWVASDALRELQSDAVQKRLKSKSH
jgi:3-methyladenine DNA glycosylase AlkD